MDLLGMIDGMWQWLTTEPSGQRTALGIALVGVLLAMVLIKRAAKWTKNHGGHLPALGIIALGLFYAAVLSLKLDPTQWIVAAVFAAVVFLGLVFFTSKRNQRRRAAA